MFYESIDDMPIYNWHMMHKTYDLSYLLLSRKKLPSNKIAMAEDLWNSIYKEYILKFGYTDDFISKLEKETEISLLIIQKCITGDESYDTMIEIIQLEIDKMEQSKSGSDFFEFKAAMESQLKFMIDIRKCSVSEFYSYIKLLQKK